MLSSICSILPSEAEAGPSLSLSKALHMRNWHVLLIFHGQSMVKRRSCFPLNGCCGLLRIPSARVPCTVVTAPSLPSAEGILEPVLKDKGILFSTMDSLWEMGWNCSAAQWIKILAVLSSVAEGAPCPSHGSLRGCHQVAKPNGNPTFSCLHGAKCDFFFFSFHCGLGREFGHLDATPRDPLREWALRTCSQQSDPALFQIHPKDSTHLCMSFANILNTSAFLFVF